MTTNEIEKFIQDQKWIFAKTMAEIPHEYVVRGNLDKNNQKLFDAFAEFIKENGYQKKFYTKTYTYFNFDSYKYWSIEDILNRTNL